MDRKIYNYAKSKGLYSVSSFKASVELDKLDMDFTDEEILESLPKEDISSIVNSVFGGEDFVLNNQNTVSQDTINFFGDKISYSYAGGVLTPYIKDPNSVGNIYYIVPIAGKQTSPIREAYILNRGQAIKNYKRASEEYDDINNSLVLEMVRSEAYDGDFYSAWKYVEIEPERFNKAGEKTSENSVSVKKVTFDKYLADNSAVTDDSRLILNKDVVSFTNDINEPAMAYFGINKDKEVGVDEFSFIHGWYNHFLKAGYQDVFEKYIASIFCAENKGRQAMYLLDASGQSLKSKFISALLGYCGNMALGISEKNVNTRFGIPPLIGKRLLTIGDSKNSSIIRSELIHNILGGDTVMGEYKGGATISVKIHSKMIIASNIRLELSNANHERSRVLYIEMVKPSIESSYMKEMCYTDDNGDVIVKNSMPAYKNTNNVDEIFEREMPAFVQYCINKHFDYVSTHADITLNDDQSDDLDNMSMSPFTEFANDLKVLIKKTSGKFIKPSTINSISHIVCAAVGENQRFVSSNLTKELGLISVKAKKYLTDEQCDKYGITKNSNIYFGYAMDYDRVNNLVSKYAKDAMQTVSWHNLSSETIDGSVGSNTFIKEL